MAAVRQCDRCKMYTKPLARGQSDSLPNDWSWLEVRDRANTTDLRAKHRFELCTTCVTDLTHWAYRTGPHEVIEQAQA